jgi:hypothetical protein
MPIFEVSKDDIVRLSDVELRELVARLCEAELARRGIPKSCVRWSGSQTAPDGGLDVEVRAPEITFKGDFLPTLPCGLQVKKPQMGPAKIGAEMRPEDSLRAVIQQLVEENGSYIIVSLDDDCAAQPLASRRKAMRDALADMADPVRLHTDFYDRGHLVNWLREHPGVQLWVRERLGMPMTGWRPHGRWSSTPREAEDTLIIEDGMTIELPGKQLDSVGLTDGLNAVRELIGGSTKAIRIIGLSGVGKSRFVQALFEEDVGADSLNRAAVIYADLSDTLDPTASELVGQLIVLQQPIFVVLDNCPPDVHNRLATRIRQADCEVKLITVEYDVADDLPEATNVVRLDVKDGAIAEKLVRRRYPAIGQLNAQTIAEFAGGNARLALALADRVEEREDLSSFSSQELFQRLFQQRQDDDPDLLPAAEALSLVYSFNVDLPGAPNDELAVLSRLAERTPLQMYRAAETLLRRQIAQKRGQWRAVLPHAIANRLARSALGKFPLPMIRGIFEAPGNERLLTSFGKRLGFLHEQAEAQELVAQWLAPAGILSDLAGLDEERLKLLTNVAPVAPELLLSAIERSAAGPGGADFASRRNPRFSTIVDLLLLLAYEDELFDRCIAVLTKFILSENPDERYESIRERLNGLFALYLSGTHATPDRREVVIWRALFSEDPELRSIGIGMLRSAVKADHWSSSRSFEFGARPRDYGYLPATGLDVLTWFRRFLTVAREGTRSPDPAVRRACRQMIAGELRSLWCYDDLRPELIELARALNAEEPWTEGWRAMRLILRFDVGKSDDDPQSSELRALAAELEPGSLLAAIKAYVLSPSYDPWEDEDSDDPKKWEKSQQRASERAFELGRRAAAGPEILFELGTALFSGQGTNAMEFGRGLGRATDDKVGLWWRLADLFAATQGSRNFGVLAGILVELNDRDPQEADRLLEAVLERTDLRGILVRLQSATSLDAGGLNRLHRLLDCEDANLWQFEPVGWGKEWKNVPEQAVAELLEHLAQRPGGARVGIDALGMRFFSLKKEGTEPTASLRKVSLEIVRRGLQDLDDQRDVHLDHHLTAILRLCFLPEEHPDECAAVVDALVENALCATGYSHDLDDAAALIASRMVGPLLSKLKYNSDLPVYRLKRIFRSGRNKPLLKDVAPVELAAWCAESDSAARFEFAAHAIEPFALPSGAEKVVLTAQALLLLQQAPDQAQVLSAYAKACSPSSWSGRRSEIVEPRRAALEGLREHPSLKARDQLEQLLVALSNEVERDRTYERQRDEESERTFE